MGWSLARSVLLASCVALAGCGTFSDSARIDVGPLQASLRTQLGIELQRVTPPPGQPGIPALRATFAGGDDQQRVTLLEFFEAEGVPQVLGTGRAPQPIIVLSRRNVAVLYTRTGGPDHRALLERTLNAAPLVKGLPKA